MKDYRKEEKIVQAYTSSENNEQIYEMTFNCAEVVELMQIAVKNLSLCGVVSSYVILYNNGDYEHFDGELAKAIEHLKEDRRYSNYGHNGAVLFKGKKVYSIADERTETFFT
jgi:translation elongation factor P/translation initiation factor 5A